MNGEPRPARRLASLVAVAVLIALARMPAAAQTLDRYIAAVDQYASGDENGALHQIARENPRIPSELASHARTFSDRRLRSAVMLHTELAAVLLANERPGPAALQISNAQRLLLILTDDTGRRAAARPFAIRWYAFATNLYAAQGMFDAALRVVRDGQSVYPDAGELYVARGAVFEMRGTQALSSRIFNPYSERLPDGSRRSFDAAAAEYQRALAVDADLASAHLHRGWVHYQLGDNRAAGDLEAALRTAKDDGVRYLAHLFLGALAERHGDLETARRHFEEAHRLGPFQTAAVALGRVEMQLGHADRARSITAAYAREPDRIEDPWWNYQLGGFEPGAITWLRAEARRP